MNPDKSSSIPRLVLSLPSSSAPLPKPKMIGLYGIPGSGKSTILAQLKSVLPDEEFQLYEGSEVITQVAGTGGLRAFNALSKDDRDRHRKMALGRILAECSRLGKTGIVAGHHSFWEETEREQVWSTAEEETFTHVLYLDTGAQEVRKRRKEDTLRTRGEVSEPKLLAWMRIEKRMLKERCQASGILLGSVNAQMMADGRLAAMMRDFRRHNEGWNLREAEAVLDRLVRRHGQVDTAVVVDADRTLAPHDAGKMFWQKTATSCAQPGLEHTLKEHFSGMGYSHASFRQAMLYFEAAATEEQFECLCSEIAREISMYPGIRALLERLLREGVMVAVMTCGLGRVWTEVLELNGLADKVGVIGGGRVSDGYVITPEMKRCLVVRVKTTHQAYVWAIGDSPLDIPMMLASHQAVVVVGEEHVRSQRMEEALDRAVRSEGLRASQILFPDNVHPRLDVDRLPVARLTDQRFVNKICHRLSFTHATDSASARVLMSATRNADVSGRALQEVHLDIGWYLAIHL